MFTCIGMILTMPIGIEASSNQLIIINKASNMLAFYENGKIIKTFQVATGRKASYTPEGTFRIVNKIKNRPYYTDNIPGGDPRNPLGDRWLGLDARGTYGTTYAIHGNSNPASIGTYASSGCVRMFDEEVRWLFDQVNLYTPVIITTSAKSFDVIANAHGYSAYSKLKYISVDKHSPQPNQTDITISAHLQSQIPSSYKFLLYNGSTWTTLRDFSSTNSINWKPDKPGTYKIKVQVKGNQSDKAVDDEKTINYTIFQPAALQSFQIEKPSPQPVDTTMKISSKTNDKANLIEYSVFNGNKWITVKDFSVKENGMWQPTEAGTYKVRVRIKHPLSSNAFDEEKIVDYTVFTPAIVTNVMTAKTTPQPVETEISISTDSNNHTNNLVRFLMNDGQGWNTLQDYSSASNTTWIPSKPGNFQIKIQAKHSLSSNDFDDEKIVNFTIYQPASFNSITSSNKKLIPVNSNNTFLISSTDTKEHLYQLSIYDGTNWEIIQNYSSDNRISWEAQKPGIYKMKIEIKHKLSVNPNDDVKEYSFIIYKPVIFLAILPKKIMVRRISRV